MSTLTESSAVNRIQDELKTLSPHELRMVENAIRDLQKNHAASEHSEEKENNLDFDEDKWSHPKPGAARRFIELCQKHWKLQNKFQNNEKNDDSNEDKGQHPKPEHVQDFLNSWAGCLSDLPDWDKKQIREMRLNERYGEN
ncbi:MAG: hypothetical protein LBP87_05840 [Planctomycetaceae bacterium]|jgi:hypothetical protein|nr:hypothetical protein [Planctomycetaceae bacterium]